MYRPIVTNLTHVEELENMIDAGENLEQRGFGVKREPLYRMNINEQHQLSTDYLHPSSFNMFNKIISPYLDNSISLGRITRRVIQVGLSISESARLSTTWQLSHGSHIYNASSHNGTHHS